MRLECSWQQGRRCWERGSWELKRDLKQGLARPGSCRRRGAAHCVRPACRTTQDVNVKVSATFRNRRGIDVSMCECVSCGPHKRASRLIVLKGRALYLSARAGPYGAGSKSPCVGHCSCGTAHDACEDVFECVCVTVRKSLSDTLGLASTLAFASVM